MVSSGCFGVIVLWPGSYEAERDIKSIENIEYEKTRFFQGNPTKIEKLDQGKYKYNYDEKIRYLGIGSGVIWAGVILWVFPAPPIPLVIPVGREGHSVTTQNNIVIHEEGRFRKGNFTGVDLRLESLRFKYGPRSEPFSKSYPKPKYIEPPVE